MKADSNLVIGNYFSCLLNWPFRGGEQLLYPICVFFVITAIVFGDAGKVVYVVVAVKEHSVFPVLSFVFDNLHEVLLQLLNDEVNVGFEVVPTKTLMQSLSTRRFQVSLP